MKIETTYQIATGGEEPSAETVLSINRAAQAIGMDDPVGLALMTVLRAQNDRIDQIPERIKQAAKELETSSRSKVDAVLAQAVAAAIPALTKEVVATADKIAGHKAETLKAKWFIVVFVICLVSIFSAAAGGYFYATGQIESASEVRCNQKGWKVTPLNGKNWCVTKPNVSGWILPDGYDKEDR